MSHVDAVAAKPNPSESLSPIDGNAEGNDQAVADAQQADVIEGGAVIDNPAREPRFDHGQHRALTAEKLARWFTFILAGGILIHYICFMILSFSGHKEEVDPLGQMFHGWFPALTSIVSAAATYYFAKE